MTQGCQKTESAFHRHRTCEMLPALFRNQECGHAISVILAAFFSSVTIRSGLTAYTIISCSLVRLPTACAEYPALFLCGYPFQPLLFLFSFHIIFRMNAVFEAAAFRKPSSLPQRMGYPAQLFITSIASCTI